jgi:hypothetical protein
MSSAKRHRIVHPAWARHLDARAATASLQSAENEGWPPLATAPPRSHSPGAPVVAPSGATTTTNWAR